MTDRLEMARSIPDHSISIPSSVMPILPAEPDCNPPNLWDDPSIHATNGELGLVVPAYQAPSRKGDRP